MYFQLFTLATVVLNTGLSVHASPSPYSQLNAAAPIAVRRADPIAAPAHPLYHIDPFASRSVHGSGRRLSRKVRRHGDHGTTTVTTYTTITTDAVPSASETGGACTEEPQDDATTTVTEYITITSGVDVPTATESAPAASTTEALSSSEAAASTSESSAPAPTSSRAAVIVAYSEQCGEPNGTEHPTATGGPNGDENWLNCGVDRDSGWVPPPVTLENLVYKDLATVLDTPGNPFESCKPYLSMFETMSSETGVPTIFLASIALQESGCRPGVTGGAGEIGMMQITHEKCPSDGSDCYDAMTNIRIGSEYFKKVLDLNNGNVAATMGEYNGWYQGLTIFLANNYASCARHNNLDYLQNVFNGYLQGVDPSSLGMGIYHNTCQPGQQ